MVILWPFNTRCVLPATRSAGTTLYSCLCDTKLHRIPYARLKSQLAVRIQQHWCDIYKVADNNCITSKKALSWSWRPPSIHSCSSPQSDLRISLKSTPTPSPPPISTQTDFSQISHTHSLSPPPAPSMCKTFWHLIYIDS